MSTLAPSLYCVYILRCADSSLYIGSTNDLERRVRQHNNSRSGAHYTKIRRPVTLEYVEFYSSYGEARAREALLKQLPRNTKLLLMQK